MTARLGLAMCLRELHTMALETLTIQPNPPIQRITFGISQLDLAVLIIFGTS